MLTQRNGAWMACRTFLALAVLAITAVPVGAQTAVDRQVTYTKDIAPILQRSCVHCHQPNSVAPMSLMTYEQVRPYAREIKRRTALRDARWGRGAMPPWFLERNIGIQKMKNDVSLSDDELATIAKWVDSGAPEGDPKDLPPAVALADLTTWTIGRPDLIVSSPTFIVPGVASDTEAAIGSTPTGLTVDRHISAVEFKEVSRFVSKKDRPNANGYGTLFSIHHANVAIADVGATDAGNDGGDGTTMVSPSPYEVGRNADYYPSDAGRLLPAYSMLVFNNMHIHSSGQEGTDRISRLDVGLKLFPQGYRPKYKIISLGGQFSSTDIKVDSGTPNQRIDMYWTASEPIQLMTYEPHMHAAGVRMCLEVILHRVVETLNCAGYDHNWVRSYAYEDNYAPLIPTGAVLHAISWYDNTPVNRNVSDPRNISLAGTSSTSNMFMIFSWGKALTDEQYQEEVAKRREFIKLTREDPIGCLECRSAPTPNSVRQAQ